MSIESQNHVSQIWTIDQSEDGQIDIFAPETNDIFIIYLCILIYVQDAHL